MVMTVLEANVEPDRVADHELAYREVAEEIPPSILETFLTWDAG